MVILEGSAISYEQGTPVWFRGPLVDINVNTLFVFPMSGTGFRVQDSGCRTQNPFLAMLVVGFRVPGLGFSVYNQREDTFCFPMSGIGFRVQGSKWHLVACLASLLRVHYPPVSAVDHHPHSLPLGFYGANLVQGV